jgi:hypothetical protein
MLCICTHRKAPSWKAEWPKCTAEGNTEAQPCDGWIRGSHLALIQEHGTGGGVGWGGFDRIVAPSEVGMD